VLFVACLRPSSAGTSVWQKQASWLLSASLFHWLSFVPANSALQDVVKTLDEFVSDPQTQQVMSGKGRVELGAGAMLVTAAGPSSRRLLHATFPVHDQQQQRTRCAMSYVCRSPQTVSKYVEAAAWEFSSGSLTIVPFSLLILFFIFPPQTVSKYIEAAVCAGLPDNFKQMCKQVRPEGLVGSLCRGAIKSTVWLAVCCASAICSKGDVGISPLVSLH